MPPLSSPNDLLLPVGPPRLGHPPADAVGERQGGHDGVDAAVGDLQWHSAAPPWVTRRFRSCHGRRVANCSKFVRRSGVLLRFRRWSVLE